MRQRHFLISLGCILLLTIIAGLLYWRGLIPLGVKTKKEPMAYGRELLYSGKYPEAEEAFKKLLRDDPANVRALSALGMLYYRKGDTKLAYHYWTDALKITPDDPTLQGLVRALEQDNLKPGPLYHMEIQTVGHAQSWEQHFIRGQNLYLKEDYTKAVGELKQAIDLKPDDAKIYFVLGAAYLKMDDRGQTIQAWETALKLNPEDPMVRELLNKVKNRQNKDGF